MVAIPWATPQAPAAPSMVPTTGGLMVPGPDPTANLPTMGWHPSSTDPTGWTDVTAMTPAMLGQWQNFFGSPSAGGVAGGAPAAQPVNQLVQTGMGWSPQIPWLTPGAGQTPGGPNLGNALQGLGIQPGATQLQTAANISNSPFSGDPTNPYYNLILNQMAAGTFTPQFTSVPAPAPAAPTNQNLAQMLGGQLYGNPTPEETSLAGLYGVPVQYLPNVINQALQFQQQGESWNQAQGLAMQQQQMAAGTWQPQNISGAGDRG